MTEREKALEELKKQIKLGRERLGPEGIKQLENMAKGINSPAGSQGIPADSEPYDRETAMKALEIFIQNHGDPEWLRQEILKMVNKSRH